MMCIDIFIFFLELGDTISGFFGGKEDKEDKKPTTDETAQEVITSCLQCASSFCFLLTLFPYLQFSMWVSFSFSFKFILFNFCLNSSYSLLRKSMQSPHQYFFSMDNLVYIFFCWFACFFCIKGDKPEDKSGEGKTESEAQQPKPDSGDKKVPLQNFSVFSLYVQMCCLSLGLEIILVFPLVKQAFSKKKIDPLDQ